MGAIKSNEFEGSIDAGQFSMWGPDVVLGEGWLPHDVPRKDASLVAWATLDPQLDRISGSLPAQLNQSSTLDFSAAITLSPSGMVKNVKVMSYHYKTEGTLGSIESAIRRSTFAAGTLEGKPVSSLVHMSFPVALHGPVLISGHPAFLKTAPVTGSRDFKIRLTLRVSSGGKAEVRGGTWQPVYKNKYDVANKLVNTLQFNSATLAGKAVESEIEIDVDPDQIEAELNVIPERDLRLKPWNPWL